jgi:hypothetical protein
VSEQEWDQAGADPETDQDPWITGHPFTSATFRDAWPGICGHEVDGLPCGYSREEHADQGEVAPADGAEPDRAAEFERTRRERLESATGEVTPTETP